MSPPSFPAAVPTLQPQGCMGTQEIKSVFNESAPKLGSRDCKVERVSAITGCDTTPPQQQHPASIPLTLHRSQNVDASLKWLTEAVKRNTRRPPAYSDIN